MHYKSQVSINYYSTLSSECIQESLPDQLTIDRSSFRVPWWLLWLITTLPSSVAAWQSSFDIFPNCCGCSSHHEVLSWPHPAPITRWWSVILLTSTTTPNNNILRSLFIRDIIWQESRTLKNEKFLFTIFARIINDCVEGMRALVSFIFPIIQNRRQSSRELLECPVHTSPHPLSRSHRNISFSWRVREGNLSTCQVQIKTVNLNFNLLDQFNLFKASPPFWWISSLNTCIVAQNKI